MCLTNLGNSVGPPLLEAGVTFYPTQRATFRFKIEALFVLIFWMGCVPGELRGGLLTEIRSRWKGVRSFSFGRTPKNSLDGFPL